MLMAGMEMNRNLNKLANFSKFILCIVRKEAKNLIMVCPSSLKSVNIFFRRPNSNFMLEERFFVKYLNSFDQNTAN